MSETLCILLIPFFLKRFGIKRVMLMAMFAWVLRFGLFGLGNPGGGVWMFVLSMIVYGVAFDFFNVSGSLYVNNTTDVAIRSSAQGLFMIMTNGIGAMVGTLGAQVVVNRFVYSQATPAEQVAGWVARMALFRRLRAGRGAAFRRGLPLQARPRSGGDAALISGPPLRTRGAPCAGADVPDSGVPRRRCSGRRRPAMRFRFVCVRSAGCGPGTVWTQRPAQRMRQAENKSPEQGAKARGKVENRI